MDKLFNAPSGPISHREVRAAVAEEISDPVVDAPRTPFNLLPPWANISTYDKRGQDAGGGTALSPLFSPRGGGR